MLPEGVGLSAFRILQEALSNAMRHAPGTSVQVRLYYGEVAIVIEVRNDSAQLPPSHDGVALPRGGGHGIIGMRERATMLGGHLSAGLTTGDEWLVTAALPLDAAIKEPQ